MASRTSRTSRKSSKTTTQRRQNLLRSVAFRPTGRKMTTGEFRLGPQTMTETQNNRVVRNSYYIVKDDLRRLLNAHPTTGLAGGLNIYYTGNVGMSVFNVTREDDSIRIGCKLFVGKDAKRLQDWAGASQNQN